MLSDLENGPAIALSVERLLRVADINDRLPTPVGDLVEAAGLSKTNEVLLSDSMIKQAPKELRKLLRAAARKVSGVLDRRERVIQIAPTSSTGRENFITCHEITHDILPWQRDLQVLADTSQTLSPAMTLEFEREANQGGAELLFQRDLLQRIAREHPIDISTPALLSEMFGASFHSTFRRWIEGLDFAVCGLVLDTNTTQSSQRRARYEHVTSSSWASRFSRYSFPRKLDASTYPFAANRHGEGDFKLNDAAGDPVTLQWQAYSTPYRMFVVLWVPAKQSFVAERRKAPKLQLI